MSTDLVFAPSLTYSPATTSRRPFSLFRRMALVSLQRLSCWGISPHCPSEDQQCGRGRFGGGEARGIQQRGRLFGNMIQIDRFDAPQVNLAK